MAQLNSDNIEPELNLKGGAVEEITKRIIREFLRETAEQGEDELRETALKLYGLLLKLARRGKDEVKSPLRALRDEVSRCEFTSEMSSRNRLVELLFQVYDKIESLIAQGLNKADEKEFAAVVFEEFRTRFARLIVGETWEEAPRLRLIALKRLYTYKCKQAKNGMAKTVITREEGGAKVQLSRKISRKLGGAAEIKVGAWEDSFEELVKAPSPKLFPLLKLLLIEVGPDATPPKPIKSDKEGSPSAVNKVANVDELLDLRDAVEAPATPGNDSPLHSGVVSGGNHEERCDWIDNTRPVDPWKQTFTLNTPEQPAFNSAFEASGPGPDVSLPHGTPSFNSTGFSNGGFLPTRSSGSIQSVPSLGSTPSLTHHSRSVSGSADFNPFNIVGDSPYLGKKKPFKDTTFSDLNPTELGARG